MKTGRRERAAAGHAARNLPPPREVPRSGGVAEPRADGISVEAFSVRIPQATLDQFAHYRADIDGFGLHFIHERGKEPDPLPIILLHGWPDTFFRMHKIIPMLTDPASDGSDDADAFDVVVPSLPGYGFSDRPSEKGFTGERFFDVRR